MRGDASLRFSKSLDTIRSGVHPRNDFVLCQHTLSSGLLSRPPLNTELPYVYKRCMYLARASISCHVRYVHQLHERGHEDAGHYLQPSTDSSECGLMG